MTMLETRSDADTTLKAGPTPEQTPIQTVTPEQPVMWDYLDNDGTLVRFHADGLVGFTIGAARVDVYEEIPTGDPEHPYRSELLTDHSIDFLRARTFVDRLAHCRRGQLVRQMGGLAQSS